MPVQTVSDSQAWGQFLKATQVARTRNAAFSPAGPASGSFAAAKTAQVPAGEPVARTYAPSEPVKEKAILGTKFDAYA
jgi:hypothetical protein